MKTVTLTVKNEKDYRFLIEIAKRLGFNSLAFISDKTKRKRKMAYTFPDVVDKLCGKYRTYLNSSDSFSKRKRLEIEKEK